MAASSDVARQVAPNMLKPSARASSSARSGLRIPALGRIRGAGETGETIDSTGNPTDFLLRQLIDILRTKVLQPRRQQVLSKNPVGLNVFDSDAFHWVDALPLSLHTVNNTDVSFRIQVHVNAEPNTSLLMRVPVHEWDIGSGEHVHETISPSSGDVWGEFVWFHCLPLSAASMGVLTGQVASPGRV